MAGNRRERELARAKAERQQERRTAKESQRRRTQQIIGVVVGLAVVIGAVVWFALGRTGDTVADDTSPTPAPTAEPTAQPTAPPTPAPTPAPTSTGQPVAGCTAPPAVRPDDLQYPEGPDQVIQPGTSYTLDLATNCGPITIATLPEAAPETVNSMVFLAEQGYFDLTACHRLTTEGIFVLQCGDPAGNGTGGPGYAVPDENLPPDGAANYPAGTVAMANAGPGTAGSQFFIVYADTTLPPAYTIWGEVTAGLDQVQAIAAAGVSGGGADGPPAQQVVIEQATVVD